MDTEQTYSSKLALFQKPYIESSVEEVQYINFLPTSTVSRLAPSLCISHSSKSDIHEIIMNPLDE